MRPKSRRRTSSWFRPHVLALEERLPLGDGLLGLLVGGALLPPRTGALAGVQPAPRASGERGVLTPRFEGAVGGFTVPARQEEALAAVFADVSDAGEDWTPLTDPFAPAARRRHDTFIVSPPREQGLDAAHLLAPLAGEVQGTSHAFAAPTPRTDGVLLATLAGMWASETPLASVVTPAQEAQVKENFGKLPLYFEQNVGQTDASVHFFARGPGYGLFLTSTEAVMVLSKPTPPERDDIASDRVDPGRAGPHTTGINPVARQNEKPPAVVRMQLVGANATPAVTGRDEQPGKVNYFLGNDPAKWHTNIATFDRVQYDDVYPGIDLVWHGSQRQLEYDFVVSPGADPSVIRVNVSGAERLAIDAAGDLVVTAGGQELRQHQPFVYQEAGGVRQEVASRFVLEGQQVRFAVGAYDASLPLVIDPVLSYSTYLGGSGTDEGWGLAVDPASSDALVTGYTASGDFPTANPLQASNRGVWDVFVTRLNAAGSALVFSTYLGGSVGDFGQALAVDPTTGDALLTGSTLSTNFPTANPLQASNRGGWDVFVARLRADGSALVFSTYLGGSSSELGRAIAVDPASGDALVTGQTNSTNFPTANPLQVSFAGGSSDVFVARLNAAGTALVFSTYLGGSSGDIGFALAVDAASGDALVTGDTGSTNFPTASPLQASNRGGNDVFVTRLNAAGSALVFSTYHGGSDNDYGFALAVDPASGDTLITGYTRSTDFPTANPLQASHGGGFEDVIVTRLNAAGSALVFSTYLGGSNYEYGRAIAVDPASGDALIVGYTGSTNFPTANPLQAFHGGNIDVIVTRLNAAGSALVFSTYLGGSIYDYGYGIAVDPASGDALVAGITDSPNFPTTPGAFDRTCGTDGLCDDGGKKGGGPFADAFVTRIGSSPVAYYYVYPDSGQVQAGVPFDLYVFALDAGFNIIPDYTGLILFYATDPEAQTPVYHYFQRPNPGYAYFPGGLTFNTPGVQELYVFDWPGVQVFGYAAFQVV